MSQRFQHGGADVGRRRRPGGLKEQVNLELSAVLGLTKGHPETPAHLDLSRDPIESPDNRHCCDGQGVGVKQVQLKKPQDAKKQVLEQSGLTLVGQIRRPLQRSSVLDQLLQSRHPSVPAIPQSPVPVSLQPDGLQPDGI